MFRLPVSVVLSFFFAFASGVTQAGEIAAVKFADYADVGGQSLQLNGLGIRYRTVFKVYAAGLYLPKKSKDAKEVLAMPGAKKLHAVLFRDLEGDLLGRLLMQGIRDNSTQTEIAHHLVSISKLGQAFSERKKLSAGDNFSVDFDPKVGPQIRHNGKLLVNQPNDPAFNSIFLRIWLGESPADHILKKGLLNHPTEDKPAGY